jgi:hypothetical protein
MKLTLKLTLKFLINFFIFIFILAFFIFIIWFRYIRERLPRDIPFNLSLIGFIIIICICIGYIYAIYKYIKPESNGINTIVKVKKYLFKPIELLITFFRHNEFTKENYEKLLLLFLQKAKKMNYLKAHILINILPRVILLSLFIIDIFYFQSINYFYKILIIGIIIIIGKIIIHIYVYVKDTSIEFVEERIEIYCHDVEKYEDRGVFARLTVKELVEEQTMRVLKGLQKINYIPSFSVDFVEKENEQLKTLPPPHLQIDIEALETNARHTLNLVISINKVLYQYELEVAKFKYINILINLLYVICWVYILIVSFPTMDLTFLEEINKGINEPFSS